MTRAENVLKSMALAGVEWELRDTRYETRDTNRESRIAGAAAGPARFAVPKAAAPVSNESVLKKATLLASKPDVAAAVLEFTEHPLHKGAKNAVPPHISGTAKILAITDIPSREDDAAGKILSGAEGDLFDKMLGAIGLGRDMVSITPLVFWRPAGGRAPTADELSFCRPFIDRIIKDFSASAGKDGKILTLGALAAKEIAGAALPKDHGKVFGNVIPIYKPDFILQNPDVKKDVWAALKLIRGT